MKAQTSFVIAAMLLVAFISGVIGAQDAPAGNADNADEKPLNIGDVTKVIAYRGQALVTRKVNVGEGTGLMEVVVSKLPPYVFQDSLFADGTDGVEVRAVRYRTRAVGKDMREDVRTIHEAIEELDTRLRENTVLTLLIDKQAAFLDQLDKFSAPTAMAEIKKGVLNAKELQALATFSFTKREELVKARLELEKTAKGINKDKQLLSSQLAQLGASNTTYHREAVIFVDKSQNPAASINLNYLVGQVNWRPTYNVRAQSGRDAVDIEYSALVTQASGEDWDGVELTLSTASPALIAQGADLSPMLISLCAPGKTSHPQLQKLKDAESYSRHRANLRQQQLDVARSGVNMNEMKSLKGYREESERLNRQLNKIAGELWDMEARASREVVKAGNLEPEGISVEYRLPGTTGLASRRDQQLVNIAKLNLEAEFAFVATPILSDYVYLQAEAKNNSNTVLLEGGYSAYLDDRFVGKSAIPMVARGQSFTTGFGIDSQLRVSRELLKKTSIIRGGNRETTFSYRLLLQNYKDSDVTLRISDRMPHVQRSDIRVTLNETSEKLSTDKEYVRDDKRRGILRWDIKVAKGSTGGNAKEITYSYTIEYDKQMSLTVEPNN